MDRLDFFRGGMLDIDYFTRRDSVNTIRHYCTCDGGVLEGTVVKVVRRVLKGCSAEHLLREQRPIRFDSRFDYSIRFFLFVLDFCGRAGDDRLGIQIQTTQANTPEERTQHGRRRCTTELLNGVFSFLIVVMLIRSLLRTQE